MLTNNLIFILPLEYNAYFKFVIILYIHIQNNNKYTINVQI